MDNDITSLPYEVAFEYMLKLDPRSLQSMCRVNKMYANICDDEYFWKKKIEIDYKGFTISNCDDPKRCWIRLYKGSKYKLDLIVLVLTKVKRGNEPEDDDFSLVEEKYEDLVIDEGIILGLRQHILNKFVIFQQQYNMLVKDGKLSDIFAFKINDIDNTIIFIFVKSKFDPSFNEKFSIKENKVILDSVSKLIPGKSSFLPKVSSYYKSIDNRVMYYNNSRTRKITKEMYQNDFSSIKTEETRFLVGVGNKHAFL